jgi:hypothetical protein
MFSRVDEKAHRQIELGSEKKVMTALLGWVGGLVLFN